MSLVHPSRLKPRPRINLVLHYGVLAPHAEWRQAVLPSSVDDDSEAPDAVWAWRARRPPPEPGVG